MGFRRHMLLGGRSPEDLSLTSFTFVWNNKKNVNFRHLFVGHGPRFISNPLEGTFRLTGYRCRAKTERETDEYYIYIKADEISLSLYLYIFSTNSQTRNDIPFFGDRICLMRLEITKPLAVSPFLH